MGSRRLQARPRSPNRPLASEAQWFSKVTVVNW
jgi:hypothetical protein